MKNLNTNVWVSAMAFAVYLLGSMSGLPTLAQSEVTLPGVISQLTLDRNGKIQCQLHFNDRVSAAHHLAIEQNTSFGASKSLAPEPKKKKGTKIIVNYVKNDPSFSNADFNAAKSAFQSAVDIWAKNVKTDVPIYILAVFEPLGTGVLGSAGTTQFYANYSGLQANTWYGNALADKLTKRDLNPSIYDITARFSTVFPNWYFGTNGKPPANKYDFRSVVLHEICHGLGFFGSMTVRNSNGVGSWGFGISNPVLPSIYDRSIYDTPKKLLIESYPNFSKALGNVLLDDPLLFMGTNTNKVTKKKGAKIFTVYNPGNNWLPGSSYSHLDFDTYAGSKDGLMVPALFLGLGFKQPGKIVKAIFDDLGWNGKVKDKVKQPENLRVLPDIPEIAEEIENEVPSLNLYPNEVRTQFVLDVGNDEFKLHRAQMIDMLGRIVPLTFTQENSRYIDFDISNSPVKSGLYFLQLEFTNRKAEVLRIAKVQ